MASTGSALPRTQVFFVSSRRRHTILQGDWSSDVCSSDLARGEKWWGWAPGKSAMEWLFWTGALSTSWRRNFERVYDLTERVIPKDVLRAPAPSEEESHRRLLEMSIAGLCVATVKDLADYFRI